MLNAFVVRPVLYDRMRCTRSQTPKALALFLLTGVAENGAAIHKHLQTSRHFVIKSVEPRAMVKLGVFQRGLCRPIGWNCSLFKKLLTANTMRP